MKTIVALAVILPALAGAARAQEAPAPAPEGAAPAPPTLSSLELADRLRAMGSYSECAVEALREAYVHPEARQRGFERAALCLSMTGRYEDARRLMLSLAAASGLDGRGRLRVCLTEVFMRELGAPACPDFLRAPARDPADARSLALGRHTLVMRALEGGKWQPARELLATGPPGSSGSTLAGWQAGDRALLEREAALPRRSPWLAAALSAVIPGLGRVYIGRWQDGLVSFLLVGVAAGLSARSFHEDGTDSVTGWLLGATAAVFYVGNIYGSAVGALVQHRESEKELLSDVHREYHERLDP